MESAPSKPALTEFVVIHRDEEKPLKLPTRLDRVEQWSKILAAVAIPVLIAVFGALWQANVAQQTATLQQEMASKTMNQEYVKLAVQILESPKSKEPGDPALRAWAVDLLNENSRTQIDPNLKALFVSGLRNCHRVPRSNSASAMKLPP